MTNTTFKEVCDLFFNKIKDYSFIEMPEDIAYEVVIGYIKPACLQFQSCTQELEVDETLQEFDCKLTNNNIQMLVNYMVIEYIDSNYLRTAQALRSRLSSADFKSLNLPQQLSKVMELRSMLKSENDQLAINKSYKNSPLFDLVLNRKKV